MTLAVTVVGCDPSPTSEPRKAIPVAALPLERTNEAPVALNAPASPCPLGMANLGTHCIDRYEAHLLLVEGVPTEHSPYERPRPGRQYRAASAPGKIPQAYINRYEAEQACRNSGKRLCTGREWQYACKGPAEEPYPYGALEIAGRCNTGKPHLPTRLFGNAAKSNMRAVFSDPRLNQEPGFLAKTGEYAGCVGQYGVFDLVGNLHEWVSDPVRSSLPNEIAMPHGVQHLGKRGNGVFLGGYFSSRSEHGRGCGYVTTQHAPHYHDYSIGFRCCADVSPVAASDT